MNIGLSVDPTIDPTTKEAIEATIAAIMKGWLVEHNLDGTHLVPVAVPIAQASFLTDTNATNFKVGIAQAGVVFQYQVRGSRLWLQVLVRGCTVTNTPAQVRVVLPNGWLTADAAIVGMGWASDNGTPKTLVVSSYVRAPYVICTLLTGTWTNSTALTQLGFTAECRVTR